MTTVPNSSLAKAVKSLAGSLIGSFGGYGHKFRSQMTIVAFHRISEKLSEDGLTCTPEKFADFCAFFSKYFRVVPFADQVQGCMQGIDMGGTLSITFDDGYLDNFEVAAPILRKYKLPATFFIATGFIGTQCVPAWDYHLPVQSGWMTWDHIRSLVTEGFDIGGHTHTHINMGSCDIDMIRAELLLSKRRLQEELSRDVTLFAYPFGGREHISEEAMNLVKEVGFLSCASCCGGTNAPVADAYRLNRIGIADWFSSPHQFGFEMLLGRA